MALQTLMVAIQNDSLLLTPSDGPAYRVSQEEFRELVSLECFSLSGDPADPKARHEKWENDELTPVAVLYEKRSKFEGRLQFTCVEWSNGWFSFVRPLPIAASFA